MTQWADKNVLAIDTSSFRLVLGLSFGDDRIVKSEEKVEKSHGQIILRKVDDLVRSAGITPNQIHAIAVSTGPGSFTGLRIGIAAAKGIAVALAIPVVGISLLEIAAYKLGDMDTEVYVIIPLKRDEVYVARCEKHGRSDGRIILTASKGLKQIVGDSPLAGIGFPTENTFDQLPNENLSSLVAYDAADLINLGKRKLASDIPPDLSSLEPVYVQKSQAEINFELKNKK